MSDMILSPQSQSGMPTPVSDSWPHDYEVLDDGKLFVRRDFLPAFIARGWTSCQAVMLTDQCIVIRRVEERDNCLVHFDGPGGSIKGYLKRHWTCRPGMSSVAEDAPGTKEAQAVALCQAAGVNSMSIIAAGKQHFQDRVESFFMSQEIDGLPADDFWKRRMGQPHEKRADSEHRLALLDEMAQTARRFHQANLFHRDFYWCHFFVSEPVPGEFHVRLIDLQRLLQPSAFRWRWLLKDLAQFRFSIPKGYLSDEEIRFWFDQYFGIEDRSWVRRVMQSAIWGRAILYERRELRRAVATGAAR